MSRIPLLEINDEKICINVGVVETKDIYIKIDDDEFYIPIKDIKEKLSEYKKFKLDKNKSFKSGIGNKK